MPSKATTKQKRKRRLEAILHLTRQSQQVWLEVFSISKKILLDDSFRSTYILHMAMTSNTPPITPQRIKRYLQGFGLTSLVQEKKRVECLLNRDVEVTGWDEWQKKGMTDSDLTSDIAQTIAELVTAYEESILILTPTQVRSWRETMKLSQPDAADYLGVSRSTWSRWEQLGIVDHFAGTAAYALAASVTSMDPALLLERTKEIHRFFAEEAGRIGLNLKTSRQKAIAISRMGGMGYYARLGLGSLGLYHLLTDAWDTKVCSACSTKNPVRAKFCLNCGSAMEYEKEADMSG